MQRCRLLVAVLIAGLVVASACGDESGAGSESTTSSAEEPGVPGATVPDREPDVTGIVRLAAGASDDPTLDDASDEYFQGMSLVRGDPLLVSEATGEVLPRSALQEGAPIAVWVEGPCAESYPVQCTIAVLQLRL